jgi:hypothetical protein
MHKNRQIFVRLHRRRVFESDILSQHTIFPRLFIFRFILFAFSSSCAIFALIEAHQQPAVCVCVTAMNFRNVFRNVPQISVTAIIALIKIMRSISTSSTEERQKFHAGNNKNSKT